MKIWSPTALCLNFVLFAGGLPALAATPSGPIVLDGKSGTILQGLRITSSTGPCVVIRNSNNITIKASEIGPCRGNAVVVSNSSQVNLYDNYIHPEAPLQGCCDKADGVYARGVTGLTLQGNIIAFGESNIQVQLAKTVRIRGNFLLNPRNGGSRGQQFQCSDSCTDLVVEDNYALASTDAGYAFSAVQEDAINVIGAINSATIQNNFIRGGRSTSGCGILLESSGSGVQVLNNILSNTGQCGIGVVSGANIVVDGNQVLNLQPVVGGGNAGLYLWKHYAWLSCSGITVSNNTVAAINVLGQDTSYWYGGGCTPYSLSGNKFGPSARGILSASASMLNPPAIPPRPFACTAPSPFTNQKSVASCDGAPASDSTPPSVSITSPTQSQSVSGTVVLAASVQDNAGVAGVQFQLDGNPVGSEVTTAPYTYSLTAAPGTYRATAVARDTSGNRTTSAATTFFVVSTPQSTTPSVNTSGLALWLKADQGIQNSSGVAVWEDQSNQNADVFQNTVALRPQLASTSNGIPVVRFDGAQDFLTIPFAIENWGQMTVFLVSSSNAWCPDGVSWGTNATIFWDETDWWGSSFVTTHQNCVAMRFGTTQVNNTFQYNRPQPVRGLALTTALRDGSTDSAYHNGNLILSGSGKLSNINGTTNTGYLGRGIGNTYFNGDIAEVLIYNRTLGDTERKNVEAYLMQKYKLQ